MIGGLGLTPRGTPPPPDEEDDSSGALEPTLTLIGSRPIFAGVTFREAVLTSIIAHALAVIVYLVMPPGTFGAKGGSLLFSPSQLSDRDDAVPLEFIQDRPRPPEPNPDARAASDRDRRRAQEEAPPNPSRVEPFSRGNTPAKIAQGPVMPAAPPAPPTPAGQDPSPPPGDPAADSASAKPQPKGFEAPERTGPFYVPPPSASDQQGEGETEGADKGRRLRETLARMGAQGSIGGGGGSPYKFDNPVGGLDTPTGSLSFDTKGFDWGDYARKIYWIIWSNWHQRMPPAIYTGQKGIVTVRFVIEKDGTLSTIKILSESGIPAYDSAAQLALEASNPLPPLPSDFPKEREGVTGRFLYNMWGDGD